MKTKKCGWCQKEYRVKNYRADLSIACSTECRGNLDRGKQRKPDQDITGCDGYRRTKIQGNVLSGHRYVVREFVGRPLARWEFVHHINGNKADNRIENLQIVTPKEHSMVHGRQKHPIVKPCMVCGLDFAPAPTKRKSAKTCSPECRRIWQSKVSRQPDAPNSMYRSGAYPCQKKNRIEA